MFDKKTGLLGKYREIVIAVAFFLVFDLGVLILNFYTSYQISEDAVAINLAGRQRMLSQRMTKSLLLLQDDTERGVPAEQLIALREELANTVRTFDTTFSSFRDGGSAPGANGSQVVLKPVQTARGREILARADTLWRGYYAALERVIADPAVTPETLGAAVAYGRANNVKLLGLMNDLTNDLEQVASEKAGWLRRVQTAGIALALLNFVFILFKFIRQLRASDAKTEAAQQETQEILSTVREGLFLLDPQYRIGTQQSQSMKTILQHDLPPGTDFLPVLQGMVPGPVYDAACGYVELLFGNRVKEGLVASLNPLSEVEVKLPDGKGEIVTRYLSFQFNRVVQDKQVPHLLVTVQDVTERVQLVRQLAAAKSEARLEVDVLLRMLATEPSVLRDFLATMDEALQQINDDLRSAGERGGEYRHVVSHAFRLIHACKGEAALLGLEMLEVQAHEFEQALAALRERGTLDGNDMVALTVALNTLFDRVNMVRGITERIAALGGQAVAAPAPAAEGLESLAQRIASAQNKQVYVSTELDALERLPGAVASDLRQIAVQLVRNAVTHGIEAPEERQQLAKPLAGRIHVACQPEADGSFQFVLRDDGRGLSPERIRLALVKAGDCSVSEAAAMTERQLVMRIFEPGFSTAESVDVDAGRGVGMDVVLNKVKALGGKLHLSTRPNEYTEFLIRFPGFAAA